MEPFTRRLVEAGENHPRDLPHEYEMRLFASSPTICVRALDVTQNDDYWDTSGYVNPEPDAASAITSVDVFVSNGNVSNAMDSFTSIPKSGFYIMVR